MVDLSDLSIGVGGWAMPARFALIYWELCLTYLIEIYEPRRGSNSLPSPRDLMPEDFILISHNESDIYDSTKFLLRLDLLSAL